MKKYKCKCCEQVMEEFYVIFAVPYDYLCRLCHESIYHYRGTGITPENNMVARYVIKTGYKRIEL